jgi:disulfide bond formation protein DsbB
MPYAQTVVQLLSVLTVIAQVLIVALIALLITRHALLEKISRNALLLMFVVSLIATIGSLFFSDIALWTPCKLCWYQRIFMYPQVVLLFIALWRKDRNIVPYILALSAIGAGIAVFHYGEQVIAALYPAVIDPNVPCDTSGTSCASTPFFHFGYITIPMMALTAFVLNILGSLSIVRSGK